MNQGSKVSKFCNDVSLGWLLLLKKMYSFTTSLKWKGQVTMLMHLLKLSMLTQCKYYNNKGFLWAHQIWTWNFHINTWTNEPNNKEFGLFVRSKSEQWWSTGSFVAHYVKSTPELMIQFVFAIVFVFVLAHEQAISGIYCENLNQFVKGFNFIWINPMVVPQIKNSGKITAAAFWLS